MANYKFKQKIVSDDPAVSIAASADLRYLELTLLKGFTVNEQEVIRVNTGIKYDWNLVDREWPNSSGLAREMYQLELKLTDSYISDGLILQHSPLLGGFDGDEISFFISNIGLTPKDLTAGTVIAKGYGMFYMSGFLITVE